MDRSILTDEEKTIISNPEDIPLLEKIKGMSREDMLIFYSNIFPADYKHYMSEQETWLATEIYLIRNRPGHSQEVSEEELLEDLCKNNNHIRFRIFYTLKYRDKVRISEEVALSLDKLFED